MGREWVARVGWVCVLVGLVVGCDTVADITFNKETLSTVRAVGFRPAGCGERASAVCVAPGCGRLDFVLETNLGRYLVPNQQLVKLPERLTPGTNFGASGDVTFGTGWVFQLDAEGLDATCVVNEDCAAAFQCLPPAALDARDAIAYGNQSLCVREATVAVNADSLRFTHYRDDPQPGNSATRGLSYRGWSILLGIDNSGSLAGTNAAGTSTDRNLATDPSRRGLAGFQTLLAGLFDKNRGDLGSNLEVGVFSIAGSGALDVRNLFLSDAATKSTFTRSEQKVRDALAGQFLSAIGLTPLWEAVLLALDVFPDGAGQFGRGMVLFTDGPADGSLTGFDLARVLSDLDEIRESNQQVPRYTVIHLDSRAPVDEGYTRTGPISAYRELACASGGYYAYQPFPAGLDEVFRRMALAYESVWSVEVQVTMPRAGGLDSLNDLPPGWYRLATSMRVRLAEAEARHDFELRSVGQEGALRATADGRLLFEVE